MKVTIPKTFTLEVDYDELCVIHSALCRVDEPVVTPQGVVAAERMAVQTLALISLASGADEKSVPFIHYAKGGMVK